jgi:hypothetical protein
MAVIVQGEQELHHMVSSRDSAQIAQQDDITGDLAAG